MNHPPKLSFACPLPWQNMTGDERSKFCSQCGHHVRNLSLLRANERAALLQQAKTERVCGTYYLRLSGEMVTPDQPLTEKERGNIRQFGVAALSAGALVLAAGCVAPQANPAVPTLPTPPPAVEKHAEPKSADNGQPAEIKPDDDVIVLFMGMIVCEPPKPAPKPGPQSKHW